ncbi:MAG: hypothetical protein JWQ74_2056 [Marmoricola sp.]|nr:hypothetical protein [Marmoricola sp.]
MAHHYVEVTGTGAATQAPDRIDLNLGLTAVRPDVGEALAHVDARAAELGAALRSHGLADADIRTTGTSLYEEYAGADGARAGFRAGFRAGHDLSVRVADASTVSAVVEAAVAAAGNDLRINGLTWSVADDTDLVRRAREAAFDDARAKADELATLAGRSLGALMRITEGPSAGGGIPRLALAKADAAGFAPEPGSSRTEVALVIRWSLT